MNKVFRVIWSEAQGAWVAVSETTKSHSKRSRKAALALALAAGGLLGVSGSALALGLGDHETPVGEGSIAIGSETGGCQPTDASGKQSVSIGCEAGAFSEGNGIVNIGYQAGFGGMGNDNTSIGSGSGDSVKGDNNTAIGYNAGQRVAGQSNAALGFNAGSGTKGNFNVGVGDNAGVSVTGSSNIGVGEHAGGSVGGDKNIAVGVNAGKAVTGHENSAVGALAGESVIGNFNTAFGRTAGKQIQGDSNLSLGNGAGLLTQGDGNIMTGFSSGQNIKGDNNIIMGTKATVKGSSATNRINGAVVVGTQAYSNFSDNVAIGTQAKAEHANSVALGNASITKIVDSITDAAITTAVLDDNGDPVLEGGIPKTKTHTYGGFFGNATGVVSVGSAGAERQIVNVAPGAITAVSTDAINGSQLYSVATGLTQQINSINTAGGWTLGSKDAAGADQNLAVAAGGKVNLDAGKNMQVTSEQAADGTVTTTFATQDDVEFDSVTTAGAVMDADGVTIAYDDGTGTIVTGPSMTRAGINAGDLKITNVQAGIADTDGVNVSQLKGLGSVIGGVNIDNTTGAVTGPTFTVNNTNYTTINEALTQLDKGWTFTAGGETDQVQAGDKVSLVAGKNMLITSTKDADGNITSTFLTEDDVDFESVTTGDSVLNNAGLQVGADVFVTNQGLQAGNTFITNGGLTFTGSTVAVTGTGINAGGNKITNVEAGVAPTDAVNVSQLESVKDIADNANKGWNVSVDGGAAHNVAPDTAVDFKGGKNIELTQNGGEITINTAAEVEFDDVKVGDVTINKDTGITVGDTNINKDGVTVGDVSITVDGIHAGDNKITGVADGTIAAGSKDAVNGGQIHDMQVQIDQQAGGWELTDGKGGKQQVKAGDTVAIVGGDNINVEFDTDGKMVVETTPDVTHNSVTTGDTVMNDNGVTIVGGPSITKGGIDAAGNKVTGVADGDINKNSTDAINGSQLHETNNRVTVNEGDIKNIQNGKDGMFQVSQDYNAPAPEPTGKKSAAGGAGAVASGDNSTAIGNDAKATASNSTALGNSAWASANNSVALGQGSVADRANSVSVGTVGGERQITNVAAGVAPTDAVNVSQLDALGSKVNQYFNAANKRIDKVDNNARAGIAAAMAAGTLPQSTLPGKSMVTVGASTYRGESALAIGVSRLSDNARTVIKANASADSRGNAGAAVGAGWHW